MYEILPTRNRVFGRFMSQYPNKITPNTIAHEMEDRIHRGMDPLQAYETVIDGIENWKAKEADYENV